MKKRLLLRQKQIISCVVVLFFLLTGVAWACGRILQSSGVQSYPEVHELSRRPLSFDGLTGYFRSLARKKGAVYAFEVLKRAPITPYMNTHVLGHTIGDELVREKGIDGIQFCTPHFRNACAHSVVGRILLEKGESALPEATRACHLTAGGNEGYTLCMHGVGHALLTVLRYDIDRTIKLCTTIGSPENHGADVGECVGGALMELVGGGEHDKAAQQRHYTAYFAGRDALYPCNSMAVPDGARPACYEYLTFRLFDIVGANPRGAEKKYYAPAMAKCKTIPFDDAKSRSRCFGGFGRDFVHQQQDEDLRKPDIDKILSESKKLTGWCALAGDSDGVASCIGNAVRTLYWNGVIIDEDVLRFCTTVVSGKNQDACVDSLISGALLFHSDASYNQALCEKIPEVYRNDCQKRVAAVSH